MRVEREDTSFEDIEQEEPKYLLPATETELPFATSHRSLPTVSQPRTVNDSRGILQIRVFLQSMKRRRKALEENT